MNVIRTTSLVYQQMGNDMWERQVAVGIADESVFGPCNMGQKSLLVACSDLLDFQILPLHLCSILVAQSQACRSRPMSSPERAYWHHPCTTYGVVNLNMFISCQPCQA